MIDSRILFDPDHMSVAGRNAALDYLEQQQAAGRPPGVVSSHSWSTPDAYPRIYRLGGFVAPYAGDSTGFVEKWRQHLGWTDPRFYFGFGFGSDMNGFGAQGDPRGADAADPVTYPFTGLGGVTRRPAAQRRARLRHQHRRRRPTTGCTPTGSRTPSTWPAPTGRRSAPTWPAAPRPTSRPGSASWGLAPDSCRNPGLRRSVRAFTRAADTGIGTRALMRRVGQPWQRLGREFTYCARKPGQEARADDRRALPRRQGGRRAPGVRRQPWVARGWVGIGSERTPSVSVSSPAGTIAWKTPGSTSVAPSSSASARESGRDQHEHLVAHLLEHADAALAPAGRPARCRRPRTRRPGRRARAPSGRTWVKPSGTCSSPDPAPARPPAGRRCRSTAGRGRRTCARGPIRCSGGK